MADQLEEILQTLRRREGYADSSRPISQQEIALVESSLVVILPADYKQFLAQRGYVEWFGHVIFGIAPDPENSVVENTIAAREAELPPDFIGIPEKAIVVKEYGGGGSYILHAADAQRAGLVSLVLDELFGREAMYWTSFLAFLDSIVNGTRNWISVQPDLPLDT